MAKKGFAVILLLIPVVIVGLGTFVFEKNKIFHKNIPPPKISPIVYPSPTLSVSPKPSPSDAPSPAIETNIIFQIAPTPTPTPVPTVQPENRNLNVTANYTVLTFDLNAITVVTDSATDDDCSSNCPAKPLAQYVAENGGRAGMNGTYFCPPDYNWCSQKVNSTDFPIWNNRKKKWMSASTLFWGGRGMVVFRPGTAQFFPNSSAVGAPSDISGGIVNYPSLLAGGNVVYNSGTLSDSDSLKTTRGTRNGIGFGHGKLFLVVARNANMEDLVNIFKSLGATDALNTDGGGSSALYDGGYKAGPGRNLPNAIIVK